MVCMINTISITDLKQKAASVITKVRSSGMPLIVMQRSKPAAVLLDPEYYKALEEALEDLEDLKAIEERQKEPNIPFKEVAKKLGI